MLLSSDFSPLLTHDLLSVEANLGGGVSVLFAVELDLLDKLRNTEEVVHLLEGETLGLGNKEPDEEEHAEAEAGVDDEATRYIVSSNVA